MLHSFLGCSLRVPVSVSSYWRRCVSSRQGSIFVFSMITLVVLLVLGVLSIQLAMQSVNRASREHRIAVAFNLAEAAADSAEAWLRAQGSPPAGSTPIDPFNGTIALTDGTCQATIYPDPGNAGKALKSYTIIATGTAEKGAVQKQVIIKAQEQSFALYSYFTDHEESPVTSGTIWFYARDRLHGPVHSNDELHIAWDSTSADPIFYDTVSSHSETVDWNPRTPGTTNEWRRVLQAGKDALALNTDRIPLPDSTDRQRDAAWGGSSGFPTTNGVYVPSIGSTASAGIFIKGNCTIQFSEQSSTGNQIIAIKQGTKTTTLTISLAGNQTTVVTSSPASTTIYSGTTNGVIYCTGNITSLKGMLANNYEDGSQILRRNAWTIATDVGAGSDITITDNLSYKTPPMSDRPATHPNNLRAPTLGLVAEDVVLSSSTPTVMTLNAVILAGGENTTNGSFYNADWDGTKKNDLRLLGGIIQKRRGPVGTFRSNNVLASGYNKDYNYDPRMADTPPPFFPTTGQYDLTSWQYR